MLPPVLGLTQQLVLAYALDSPILVHPNPLGAGRLFHIFIIGTPGYSHITRNVTSIMTHDSGKGTDGAGVASTSINSISLPWTTDVRRQTGAVDATYSNDNPYYRVHGYEPRRQHNIAPHYPTIETSLSHEYDDWAGRLLEASSILALPGADGAAQPHVLEDDLSWSQFQAYAGDSQDLPAVLHQDPWDIPNFLGAVDLEAGLTEDITDFMVPRSTSSATCPYARAGVSAEAEAGPSSEVPSASGHDSLNAALDPPAEGSSKKRKMRASDLESDTEDVPRIASRSPKKRRIWKLSPAPTAKSEQEDVAEGISSMNAEHVAKGKTGKDKERLEGRAQSSQNLRGRKASGIAALRESVFPGSVKPGMFRRKPRGAAGKNIDNDSKDQIYETSELDVILEARKKIDEAREKIEQLEDRNKKLEDRTRDLEDRNAKLEDKCAAANRRASHLDMWIQSQAREGAR